MNITIHLTGGPPLECRDVPGEPISMRQSISNAVGLGQPITLNEARGVVVINPAHVLYAVVTP